MYLLIISVHALLNSLWSIISGLLYIKLLFDTIESGEGFHRIIVISCFLICIRVAQILFDKVSDTFFKPQLSCTLHERMQSELYNKARQIDIAWYDNPKYYDNFVWAMREADTRAIKIATDLINFFAHIVTLLSMVAILFTIDPVIIVAITISFVFNLGINIQLNKARRSKSQDLQQKKRRSDYYKRIFSLPEYAVDLRNCEMSQLMRLKYQKAKKNEIDCVSRHASKTFLWTFVSQLMTGFLFDAVMTGYLIFRYALDSSFTLGNFSAGINSIWKVFNQSNAVMRHIAMLNEDNIYAGKFIEFLSITLPSHNTNNIMKEVDDFKKIEFKNVSFSYSVSDKSQMALKKISMTITKGEKIAIVGYNGAGKTTLINLLLGFYSCTEGKILYNNRDINSYDINEYRRLFGVVCQNHKIFSTTIAENIIGGIYDERDEKRIMEVIDNVSLQKKISGLAGGINTMLTKEFDILGTNLSGGEVQKIALANVLYKSPNVVVLDEPSSALDPNAEQDLNDIIYHTTKGKTLIIISHRLSCVHHVDRIYMMNAGEIIEEGTHMQLMNLRGRYFEMYNEQAKRYQQS